MPSAPVQTRSRQNYWVLRGVQLVQIRCDLENQIKGVLRTFGILFGKRVGGFAKRAEEIIVGELDASPTIRLVIEALMKARTDMLAQIRALDAEVRAISRGSSAVRHLMTVPGVGVITALGFVATIDDPARFRRSASAGAYLGLTPKIYASGETMRIGRIKPPFIQVVAQLISNLRVPVGTRVRAVRTASSI